MAFKNAKTLKVDVYSTSWTTALLPYLEHKQSTYQCPSADEGANSYGMNNQAHRLDPMDARRILMLDYLATRANLVVDSSESRCQDWADNAAFRHSGTCNVVFFDGHVESMLPTYIDPCGEYQIALGGNGGGCCGDDPDLNYRERWEPRTGTDPDLDRTSTDYDDLSQYYVLTSRGYSHVLELGPLCRAVEDPEACASQFGYTLQGPDSFIWVFDDLQVLDWNDMFLMFDPQSDGSIRVTHIAGDYWSAGRVTLVLHGPGDQVLIDPYRIGDVFVIAP